jgi:hypothetical protein
MVVALGAYFLAGFGHSPVLSWTAVAVSVAAVVVWSLHGRLIGRPLLGCGTSCSIDSRGLGRENDVPRESPHLELGTVPVSEDRL